MSVKRPRGRYTGRYCPRCDKKLRIEDTCLREHKDEWVHKACCKGEHKVPDKIVPKRTQSEIIITLDDLCNLLAVAAQEGINCAETAGDHTDVGIAYHVLTDYLNAY